RHRRARGDPARERRDHVSAQHHRLGLSLDGRLLLCEAGPARSRRQALRRVPVGQQRRQPEDRGRRAPGAARSDLAHRRRDVRRGPALQRGGALMRSLCLLPLLAWPLAACGSYSTYRTTRLASTSKTEMVFGAQVAGIRAPDGAAAPLPELAVAARRGVGDRYEVQANGTLLALKQARTGSLELGGKMRVLAEGRWSLAVGAAAGYRIAESGGAIIEGAFVSAPVIGGVELGRHQLVVSVNGGYQRWYSS